MTAREAMDAIDKARKWARLAYQRVCDAQCDRVGCDQAHNQAIIAQQRLYAAALIKAQIEALRRVGEPVYTLEIIQECEDALAELEAPNAP